MCDAINNVENVNKMAKIRDDEQYYLAYPHVYADSNTPKDEIRDENNFELEPHIHTFDSIHLTFKSTMGSVVHCRINYYAKWYTKD